MTSRSSASLRDWPPSQSSNWDSGIAAMMRPGKAPRNVRLASPPREPLSISINVSVRQLQQKGLVEAVAATLESTGLAPERLELELTESLFARETEQAIGILHALRALGVRLSIDDFGTGYSSLGYLKHLPISRLKIDQSFVRNIQGDQGNAAIARTIITLGQSLGLEVLAEGVETKAERDWLQGAGCELAQGYVFSRPMDASAMTELIKTFRFSGRTSLYVAA